MQQSNPVRIIPHGQPESADGWPVLTKDQLMLLDKNVEIFAVEVPTADTQEALLHFSDLSVKNLKIPTVVKSTAIGRNLVLLNATPSTATPLVAPVSLGVGSSPTRLKENESSISSRIPTAKVLKGIDKDLGWHVVRHSLVIPYTRMTLSECLSEVFKGSDVSEIPCSFETCGHIAHFNLTKSTMPYRKIIAQLTMLLNGYLKTVVTKVEALNDNYSRFRVLPMEIIGGARDLVANLKEHGVKLRVTYDKVYWNSRLSGERVNQLQRVAKLLRTQTESSPPLVLVDLMCGVGALPIIVKKNSSAKLSVIANDLNPHAMEDCLFNVKQNKM
eukprot:GHVH01004133.1.p1 GENE.GHVH01004133.1~~GHVH01004133.1.p1  ORF type:complete len:330 (-),score=40.60 GHVH01004133.1:674-1663(-)